jgi:hypothetical protein
VPDVSYFLLTSALSLLAAAAGYLDGRRPLRRIRLIAVGMLALLIAKAVLQARPAWEAALCPSADYAYFEGYWIWPLALYFFGLIAGQFPAGWNRRLVAGIAATAFIASLWSQRWMVTGLPDGSTAVADREHHCLQSAGDTCVPASCVALLSYWGIDATEGEMVRLCLSRKGTTLYNAYRGLRLKVADDSLRVRIVEGDLDQVLALGVPVLFGDGAHARVLVVSQGVCVVHDPALSAPQVWSLDRVADALRGPVVAIDSVVGSRPAPPPAIALASTLRATSTVPR